MRVNMPSGKEGFAMCFRPSALSQNNANANIVTGNCPTCGMPVAAEEGTTGGTCPYCGDPIPPVSPENITPIDPANNIRIL